MNAPIITPAAQKDLDRASRWYQEQRYGLGDDFLICIDKYLRQICEFPEMYPVIYKNLHRVLMHRFPYAIFYIRDGEEVIVIAVQHKRRHPNAWSARL